MDDIVARLRAYDSCLSDDGVALVAHQVLRDAADEIERLRALCVQVSNLNPGEVSNLNARVPQNAQISAADFSGPPQGLRSTPGYGEFGRWDPRWRTLG